MKEKTIFVKEDIKKKLSQTKNTDDQIQILNELKPIAQEPDTCDFLMKIVKREEKMSPALCTAAANILYETTKSPDDQIKLLRYEGRYAKKDKTAQQFIVKAAQKKGILSNEVGKVAAEEFYNFFLGYVQSECCNSLMKQNGFQCGMTDLQDLINEATNNCFLFIFLALDRYDPSKAALTSYFSNHIKDALDDFRSHAMGHSSKTTLQTDRKVKRELNRMQASQESIELFKVSKNTGHTVDQVRRSMERLEANNSITSLDSEEVKQYSSKFDTPEQATIKRENSKEFCDAANQLSPMEKKAFFLLMGVKQMDDELIDVPAHNISETSQIMGISEKDVNRYHASATKKLRIILGSEKKEEAEGRILNQHSVVFSESEEDEEVKNVIDTIVEIID